MQTEAKDFNPRPSHMVMVRFLAVSRAYFCADLANMVNGNKRTGLKGEELKGKGWNGRNQSVGERVYL